MVAIAEDFRAHWEAVDEFRRISELDELEQWLLTVHDPETSEEEVDRHEIVR